MQSFDDFLHDWLGSTSEAEAMAVLKALSDQWGADASRGPERSLTARQVDEQLNRVLDRAFEASDLAIGLRLYGSGKVDLARAVFESVASAGHPTASAQASRYLDAIGAIREFAPVKSATTTPVDRAAVEFRMPVLIFGGSTLTNDSRAAPATPPPMATVLLDESADPTPESPLNVPVAPWNEEWGDDAACKTAGPHQTFARGAEQNKAKQICAGCPVRMECLAEALDNRIEWGVWGGMTERERRALLRRPPNGSWREALQSAKERSADLKRDADEITRLG